MTDIAASAGHILIFDEGVSQNFRFTLTDQDDATIDPNDCITITMTLYNQETAAVINSRDGTNIKGANDATIASNVLTVRLDAADAAIVDTNLQVGQSEVHVLRIDYTWSDGQNDRSGRKEYHFRVRNVSAPA